MFGLNTLMEAVSDLNDRDISFDPILEAATDLVDDDVKQQFIDDSVEADMAGDGISAEDEKKYEKLISKIPPYNEGIEEDIASLTESAELFGDFDGEAVMA
ncbi:MAG: hypothetical protein NC548_27855 [Lachnospiraceae bacterium]|nr:hypothetical protein [Lachnospiraceae bacterium]